MNTKQLWIHIGMPKTGTSALQDFLFHNRELLANHGFLYPDLGMPELHPQHMPLVRSLSREAGSPAVFPNGGYDLSPIEFKNTIEREMESRNCHTVILSSEFFFDYPGLTPDRPDFPIDQAIPHLKCVAFLLSELFHEYQASVIVWLRRQDHWLMSMYNNAVKVANFKHDFSVFFRRQVAPWYGTILDQWADAFSPDKIRVHIYEKADDGFDVIPSFLRSVGIPSTAQPLQDYRQHARSGNLGLSRKLLLVKREVNKCLPENMPGLRHSIEDLFFSLAAEDARTAGRPESILSPTERLDILRRFEAENRRVLERFFPSTRAALFLEPNPDDSDWIPPEPPSAETLLRVFTPLFFAQARRLKALELRIARMDSKR